MAAAACRQGLATGGGREGWLYEGASTASSWLVTPPCAGVTVAVDAGRSYPDEKPSRRTLILEGRAWTHPQAPSNADSIPEIHEIIIRRWFIPSLAEVSYGQVRPPFGQNETSVVLSSLSFPLRDPSLCLSLFPLSLLTLFFLRQSLSLITPR